MFHQVNLLTHYGNTANNAYYNLRTLSQSREFGARQHLVEFGLKHAISAPAWEELEFEVPCSEWIADPQWADHPGAEPFNSIREDWPGTQRRGRLTHLLESLRKSKFPLGRISGLLFSGFATRMRRALIGSLPPLGREKLSQVLKVLMLPLLLLNIKPLGDFKSSGNVAIIYGGNFLGSARIPKRRSSMMIAFEHGTFRWATSRSEGIFERVWKATYRRNIRRCDFAFVSNLDTATIRAATELMGHRWAAVPHPYLMHSDAPYLGNSDNRSELQLATDSDTLILLGSSHNWSSLHDKGTMMALEAFRILRAKGHRVGLVTIEWGLQTDESKDFLSQHKLNSNAHWLLPLPRKSLQKLAADCDLSWNQFAYRAIGAFDLRMLEQGIPHVSMAPDDYGASLIGAHAPWYQALDVSEIVNQTENIMTQYLHHSRNEVLSDHANLYRAWLRRYHSPEVLEQIQATVLDLLSSGHPWNEANSEATWAQVTAKMSH